MSTKIVDLNTDTRVHYPGQNGFDFAVAFSDDYGNTAEIDEATIKFTMTHYSIDRYEQIITATPLTYRRCEEDDFRVKSESALNLIRNSIVY